MQTDATQKDRPRHAEEDGQEEKTGEQVAEPPQRGEHREADEPAKRVWGDGRHRLIAAQARELRYAHELVALGPQRINQLRQRRDGLGSVAARIVQQDDVAPYVGIRISDLLDDTPNDIVGGRPLPIVGIDMQAHGQIAHGLRDLDRHDLVGCRRLGVAKIGRSEKPHGAPRQPFEQALGGIDLERDHRIRHLAEIRMRKGVVPYVVSLSKNTLYQVWVGLRAVTDDEETRMHPLGLQDVEDLWRPVGIGAVVEGKRELIWFGPSPLDHIGCGYLRIVLIVNIARILVDLKGTRAGSRLLGDAQDLALPFEIDVLARPDHPQAIRRRRIIRALKDRPDRRVLGTEPPKSITGGSVHVCGMNLIEGGDAVQEPHVVALAIVLGEREMLFSVSGSKSI